MGYWVRKFLTLSPNIKFWLPAGKFLFTSKYTMAMCTTCHLRLLFAKNCCLGDEKYRGRDLTTYGMLSMFSEQHCPKNCLTFCKIARKQKLFKKPNRAGKHSCHLTRGAPPAPESLAPAGHWRGASDELLLGVVNGSNGGARQAVVAGPTHTFSLTVA